MHTGLEQILPRELKAWEEFASPLMSKSRISQKTWEMIREKDRQLDRRTRSTLLGHVLNFLQYEALRNDPETGNVLLLRTLNDRALEEIFLSRLQKIEQQQEKRMPASWLLHLSILEEKIKNDARKPQRVSNTFDEIHQTLDEYFILQKLKYTCAALNQRLIISPDPETGIQWMAMLEPYLKIREQDKANSGLSSLTWLYYYVYLTLKPGNPQPEKESSLEKILTTLEAKRSHLEQEEVLDLYYYCLNYCIRQINQKSSAQHIQTTLDIYDALLTSGVILNEAGKLSPLHFKNIASTMNRLKAFDSAEKFIGEYAGQLDNDETGVGKLYGQGLICFYRRQYTHAFQIFNELIGKSKDIFFRFDSRVYLLKIIYLRREEDPDWLSTMDKSVQAFRAVLSRKTHNLSPQHLESYRRFITCLNALARASTARSDEERKAETEKLKHKLMTEENIADKTWIMNMLNQL